MPLHIDYRPQTLEDFAGNPSMVDSLKAVLSREKDIPHSFMFTGASGCGKTTLGRIVAKSIGCSDNDFKELDSAAFRGIDTIREIRNQARLKPMSGKTRVWLLDEVHKMTNDAQNALLKILEDTPSHVYFILCTTDPQKVLKTIQSRCMQFQVNPLSERQMTSLLKSVVEKEGITDFPEEAYANIHQNSLGHVRAALVMLDKVIDLEPKRILRIIEQSKGEEGQVIDLCRALLKRESWKKIASLLRAIQEEQEAESVRYAVLGYMNSVLLKEDNPVAAICIEQFKHNFYDSGKPGLTEACYSVVKVDL